MTLWLGKLEVQLIQLGRGHTKGDTVVWLPQDKVLFSGDLVEFELDREPQAYFEAEGSVPLPPLKGVRRVVASRPLL